MGEVRHSGVERAHGPISADLQFSEQLNIDTALDCGIIVKVSFTYVFAWPAIGSKITRDCRGAFLNPRCLRE
jgi:hypothetical protein